MSIPVLSIALPGYDVASKPDYSRLGPILDEFVVDAFPSRRLALRGVSLADHPGLTRSALTEHILSLGTDRYDPNRQGVHHHYYDPLGVDLHAVPCETRKTLRGLDGGDYAAAPSFFGEFIADFFESAMAERGRPLRIDVVLAYDLDRLRVPARCESMAFAFRDQSDRRESLLGIVHILGAGEAEAGDANGGTA